MSVFTTAQRKLLIDAARRLSLDAPRKKLEDFFGDILALNPVQVADYFPDPDPQGTRAETISYFTLEREELLQEKGVIPNYIVHTDELGVTYLAGLVTHLKERSAPLHLVERLPEHDNIRTALRTLQKGHHLEAIAAAIIQKQCKYGAATQGSGDQGIDALGWDDLLVLERCFAGRFTDRENEPLPGERVFVLASSKAGLKPGGGKLGLLNPAHIRELIGGWIIQRTNIGAWRKHGIQMLSPLQLILVTTYRLSAEAHLDCRSLGIQTWTLPELVYLVCLCAPDGVFSPDHKFSPVAFRNWWKPHDEGRISAGQTVTVVE